MGRILVVDDDVITSDLVSDAIEQAGHNADTAANGKTAIKIAIETPPHLILCELSLPDLSGIEVLRHLRISNVGSPLIMFSATGSVRNVAEAMKGGAAEFLEKPIDVASLLSAVDDALHMPGASSYPGAGRHSIERWTDVVIRAVECQRDPRTLQEWARSAGVSVGALRAWCHIAGIPPKQSLNFARLLRAVILRSNFGTRFEDSLNVVDKRTLKKLLNLASIDERDAIFVETFLLRQKFVLSESIVSEISSRLRGSTCNVYHRAGRDYGNCR